MVDIKVLVYLGSLNSLITLNKYKIADLQKRTYFSSIPNTILKN
jgi:hypothetical protein